MATHRDSHAAASCRDTKTAARPAAIRADRSEVEPSGAAGELKAPRREPTLVERFLDNLRATLSAWPPV